MPLDGLAIATTVAPSASTSAITAAAPIAALDLRFGGAGNCSTACAVASAIARAATSSPSHAGHRRSAGKTAAHMRQIE
jgi:hypothetical protein